MTPLPYDRPRMPNRHATAAKADRAAAHAAAAASALGRFAHPHAPASRDAPAGWPSTRRDLDAAAVDELKAAGRQAASDVGGLSGGGAPLAGLSGAASEKAPSHVLVARALGPVAGRAIVTERRAFLAQIDAAEQRARELERQLQQEREQVPMSRAREETAYAREAMLRDERDASFAGAEAARLECERLRGQLDAERARAERAEARCEELRRAAEAECTSLRETLEVTQADWRCAEAEARQAERGLAVAQSELRAAAERIERAEHEARRGGLLHAERLTAAEERVRAVEAEREAVRAEKAAVDAERRALEQHNAQAAELMKEERRTLRAAVEAAESRCQLALNQVSVIERDRTVARSELTAAQLQLQQAAEATQRREADHHHHEQQCRSEASVAVAAAQEFARQMADRCRQAEKQAEVHSLLVDEAMSSALSGQAAANRTELMLRLERQRAATLHDERHEAQWQRFAHMPHGGGSGGGGGGGSAGGSGGSGGGSAIGGGAAIGGGGSLGGVGGGSSTGRGDGVGSTPGTAALPLAASQASAAPTACAAAAAAPAAIPALIPYAATMSAMTPPPSTPTTATLPSAPPPAFLGGDSGAPWWWGVEGAGAG